MQVDLIEGLTWTVPCDDGIIVTAAQLQHRLPCWGYVFREAGQPPLPDPAKLAASGATEVRASLAHEYGVTGTLSKQNLPASSRRLMLL